MSDVRECKDALARLGEDDLLARASAATEDIETAARFRERVGLDALERAVERATGERAARGRRVLRTFEDYRAAASGDHFRPGHDTHLGGGTQADAK